MHCCCRFGEMRLKGRVGSFVQGQNTLGVCVTTGLQPASTHFPWSLLQYSSSVLNSIAVKPITNLESETNRLIDSNHNTVNITNNLKERNL